MASVRQDHNRWVVQWRDGTENRARRFGSEAEARTFATTLPPSRRGGRRPRNRAEVLRDIATNFEVDDNGCWIWTGALQTAGYARFTWKPAGSDRVISGGHRVVLAALGDPVPHDLVVDHLCRVRHCVNPDHLDMVTQRENVMRSPIAPGAINAAKTHCAKGHPFSEENTRSYYGMGGRKTWTRICKTCAAASHERIRLAKKAVTA